MTQHSVLAYNTPHGDVHMVGATGLVIVLYYVLEGTLVFTSLSKGQSALHKNGSVCSVFESLRVNHFELLKLLCPHFLLCQWFPSEHP